MLRTTALLLMLLAAVPAGAVEAAAKPRVAVFPLAGDAAAELREKVGFAIRAKLDRDGTYDVIDGVTMSEAWGSVPPPAVAADKTTLTKAVVTEKPAVLIWGEVVGGSGDGAVETLQGATIHIQVLDLRQVGGRPVAVQKKLSDPTELRLVTEQIIAALPGIAPAGGPSTRAVVDDDASRTLWDKNPNLVANGDFSSPGGWAALYESQKYPIAPTPDLPPADKVAIHAPAAAAAGEKPNPVLAMVLSRRAAENAGLACLSDPIRIQADRRYRISFRYKSDGPTTQVFVKGYTTGKDINGKPSQRECFRTQVPIAGATDGDWQTVVADINPYHPAFGVETLRVDLYAFLQPGVILFDDVVVKEIGPLKRTPRDAAIEKPVTD